MRAVLLLFAVCSLAACSDAPDQGFLTKTLGGTFIDAVPGTEGPSAHSGVYYIPDSVDGDPIVRPDSCVTAAQGRADDVKAQGFDEDVQKRVYDVTFADCRRWDMHS